MASIDLRFITNKSNMTRESVTPAPNASPTYNEFSIVKLFSFLIEFLAFFP